MTNHWYQIPTYNLALVLSDIPEWKIFRPILQSTEEVLILLHMKLGETLCPVIKLHPLYLLSLEGGASVRQMGR